jgi:hypothetical protein
VKHLILLNDPPYGAERSFNGLRMAHALAKHDTEAVITVFLMADAVFCGKAGQMTPRRLLKYRTDVAPGSFGGRARSGLRHLHGCARVERWRLDGGRRAFHHGRADRDHAGG